MNVCVLTCQTFRLESLEHVAVIVGLLIPLFFCKQTIRFSFSLFDGFLFRTTPNNTKTFPWQCTRGQNLLKTLSPEDVITAAEGSYAYWVAKHSNTPPTEEQTIRMATRECRRHIFKVKYDDAVVNIKETCRYRKVSVWCG